MVSNNIQEKYNIRAKMRAMASYLIHLSNNGYKCYEVVIDGKHIIDLSLPA